MLLPYQLRLHFSSVAQSCPPLCHLIARAHQASLSITNSRSLFKFMSSRWCHPTVSSSVIPFSSCLQSFPASGSFQMSQFFALGGQSVGFSPSGSVLSMNIHEWFPFGLTGWISLQSKGQYHSSKASILQCSAFFIVRLSHPYMTTGKSIALTRRTWY